MARLYLTTGRTDDAKKGYDELLSQSPTDPTALLGLAEIAVAQKKWPEATDYITRARTAAPNDPAAGLLFVNMYGLQQDWKNATSAAAELVAQFPANVEVLDAQGRVQIAAGDKDGALPTYRRTNSRPMPDRSCLATSLCSTRQKTSPRSGLCCRPRSTAILKMPL